MEIVDRPGRLDAGHTEGGLLQEEPDRGVVVKHEVSADEPARVGETLGKRSRFREQQQMR